MLIVLAKIYKYGVGHWFTTNERKLQKKEKIPKEEKKTLKK